MTYQYYRQMSTDTSHPVKECEITSFSWDTVSNGQYKNSKFIVIIPIQAKLYTKNLHDFHKK